MAGIMFALASFTLGLVIAAAGQALQALREIALNTRPATPETQGRGRYEGLATTGRILGVLGALVAVTGLFAGVGSAISGRSPL